MYNSPVCVRAAAAAHADTALDSPADTTPAVRDDTALDTLVSAAASTTPTAITATEAVFQLISLMREWNRSAHKSKAKLLRIAQQLIDADPRVSPRIPPPYITDPAAYHCRRANVLMSLLVECMLAYYQKTGEAMTHVPNPTPHTNEDL